MPKNRNQKRQFWSELLSALLLQLKGYHIVGKNMKISGVEVDILACKKIKNVDKNNMLYVVAEVKFRKRIDPSVSAISSHQRKRLEMAAEKVASTAQENVRIDTFLWQPTFPFVQWIKNI